MIQRPTIQSIIDSIEGEIETELGFTISNIKGNLINILSKAFSGEIYDIYGNVLFLSKQFFPFWATGEYLDNWGSLYSVVRQLPTSAIGSITITGTVGTVIPENTILTRADGIEYITDSLTTIGAEGFIVANITCQTVGSIGNYSVGNELTFLSPIANIDPTADIFTALSNGFDIETDQSYRDRIIIAIQKESRNGKVGDWIAWAKEVSGVKNVYEYRLFLGAGTIGVGFSVDSPSSQIPDSTKIAEVKAYLESKAPVDFKEIYVLAIQEQSINLTLGISPDSLAARQNIQSAIQDYFDTLPASTKDTNSIVRLVNIQSAVNAVSGITTNIISPVSNITLNFNNIAIVGTITWV